uniref:Uncharacterized protein n=1 Tax=uncultured marine virus TaxID=186617 RepID=A0A0F7L4V6_9VIRU|nr:hypothetical protein [uncultured marine virus]
MTLYHPRHSEYRRGQPEERTIRSYYHEYVRQFRFRQRSRCSLLRDLQRPGLCAVRRQFQSVGSVVRVHLG